jgi:hypothetical protein
MAGPSGTADAHGQPDASPAPEARPPLRIALLLDGTSVPRWIAEILRGLHDEQCVTIVGALLDADAGTAPAPAAVDRSLVTRFRRAWAHRDQVLAHRYMRFDARRYPADGDDPFAMLDVSDLLGGVPLVPAHPRRTKYSDYFDEPSLEALRAMTPDVVLRFGFRILRGDVLTIPTHGVWSFHHGDNRVNRGGPPGFWEVFLRWPATGAVLQRLSEDLDGGATLARTWVATDPLSVHRNRVMLYRAAAPLLLRKLRDLHRRGAEALRPPEGESSFVPYSWSLFVAPTPSELLRGIVRLARVLVRRKLATVGHWEQWQIEYAVDATQPTHNTTPQTAPFRAKVLVPPADRYWADPFLVEADGRQWLFLEEVICSENLGRIAVVEMGPSGPIGAPRTVLERPFHLSYPFVFRHDGQWYMLPEMGASGRQELIRAVEFPFRWETDRDLSLGQPVVDPTLIEHEGRWWLFAGTAPHQAVPANELSIFYADSPLGPFTAHAMNPVATDARTARPAGAIFRVGPDMIRPAQDCTPDYGRSITFRRITRLTPSEYEEVEVGRLDPYWRRGLVGTHTINACGAVTVLDSRVRRRGKPGPPTVA